MLMIPSRIRQERTEIFRQMGKGSNRSEQLEDETWNRRLSYPNKEY